MNDFIFGTLATDALRLEHFRAQCLGVTHRSDRRPRDPRPGEEIQLALSVGPAHPGERAWVYWSTDGGDPQGKGGIATHGWAAPMEAAGVEWDVLAWGYRRRFVARLPGQPAGTVLRYRLSCSRGAGSSTVDETFADGGAYYAIYIDDDPLPAWAQDAVVYQIFVDRFAPGPGRAWLNPSSPSGFYGGTLRGITSQLDWIRDLGVTVLWLTPIFPSPSHHGYDASDLFEIEPRLGTQEDLAGLLAGAHARGLRVLLDFVPNHWSSTHASFQDATRDPHSPYRAWYLFKRWPDDYETFFGVKDLPQVNLRHPEARRHMLAAAAYWLEFGVDGFRVDYAIGPTPDFWAEFRRVTRQTQPDCWTFGEVVEPSDSQLAFHGLLDGCLDFMLLEALRQTFAFGRWSAGQFMEFLDRHEHYFPVDFSRPSFLDNHDMNRILWALQGDRRRLKLAALCQFTLAGPPVLYYGTEVGLSQARDVRQGERGLPEEARLPMLWGAAQDEDLLAFYRRLIALRRSHPQIWRARRRSLWLGEDIVAYAIDLPEQPRLLVALNLASEERQVALPAHGEVIFTTGDAGDERVPCYDSQTDCRLPAHSGIVLRITP